MHKHDKIPFAFIILMTVVINIWLIPTATFALTPEEKAYLEEMGPDRNFVGEDHIKCFEYSRLIYRYSDVFKIQMAINEIYAR